MSSRIVLLLLSQSVASAFVCPSSSPIAVATPMQGAGLLMLSARRHSYNLHLAAEGDLGTEISKAPTLNGKMVLPVKAMSAGLKGHKVAAVYAILSSNYKRGSGEGWEHVQHIGITRDLANDLSYFLNEKGSGSVAHIRALSFSYPQKTTMEEFANGWKARVLEVRGAGSDEGWGKVPPAHTIAEADVQKEQKVTVVSSDYEFDDEDEDMDEDDLDDYIQMMAESRAAMLDSRDKSPDPLFVDITGESGTGEVVSPFENSAASSTGNDDADEAPLELSPQNVDKVLDEVRPYLVADGGNVSVSKVDTDTGNVYLVLEGACGSCASSTVTMKMGIERVLKENFGSSLGEVVQVEPEVDEGGKPTELTVEAVQGEIDRMAAAISAMGGVVRIVNVDPIGVVEIEFRGPNKVKQGLELALLDVEYVKHVKFVS
mmetsp:Transcript_21617/g.45401  ORF Transcript_21617/g.45401 Transcript_21617/m.45401 type:complete len:430 (+) Transcript_21617:104-1393(+)